MDIQEIAKSTLSEAPRTTLQLGSGEIFQRGLYSWLALIFSRRNSKKG